MSIKGKVKEAVLGGVNRIATPFRRIWEAWDYPSAKDWLSHLMRGGATFGDFLTDIYGDTVLTPHEEMWACERMFRDNAFITSSVLLLRDIILGNNLSVETDDDFTREFWEQKFVNSGYLQALGEAIENYIKCGNGYIELLKGLKTGLMKKAIPIARAWRIWVIPKENGIGYDYIEQLPTGYRGEGVKNYTVEYKGGYRKLTIRGILFKNEIQHFKNGSTESTFYGRSLIAPAISDAKVLREIERAMAVIARYKAIPRKVINLRNPDGSNISSSERDKFIDYWNSLTDIENPVITGKVIELADLSYAGSEMRFQEMIECA